jgi:hypothetical protein
MNSRTPWYVEQRTQALAVLLLTERDDLAVKRPEGSDDPLDLIVEILERGRPTKRLLGIRLEGTTSPLTEKEVARAFTAVVPKLKEVPIPVCGFLFDVKRNVGSYLWLNEPLVSEQGEPRLEQGRGSKPSLLDEAALASIIDQVNRWYDALLTLLKGEAAAG